MTEQPLDIINKLKEGENSAYEYLYDRYFVELFIYAKRIVKDEESAKEIVQDVVFNLWRVRDTLDKALNLKSYLYKSVQNASYNHLKHLKIVDSYKDDFEFQANDVQFDNHELMIEKELEHKINEAVEDLPEQCRKVFKLSRFEGLKYKEIADKLEISVKMVEAHVSKALNNLSEKLKDYMYMIFF